MVAALLNEDGSMMYDAGGSKSPVKIYTDAPTVSTPLIKLVAPIAPIVPITTTPTIKTAIATTPIAVVPVPVPVVKTIIPLPTTATMGLEPMTLTPKPVTTTNSTTVKLSTMTLSFKVLDEFGDPLPLANISVDGKATAQTNNNGLVTISNLAPSQIIKVTYMGLSDYVSTVGVFPGVVTMKTTAIQLDGVTIIVPKKETTVPVTGTASKAGLNWLWILLLAGTARKMYLESQKSKTVKAKI
jgi:hypothetical protein